MPTKTKNSQKTERIRQRLEQLKATRPAAPAVEEEEEVTLEEVPLTESDAATVKAATTAPVKTAKPTDGDKEEFTLDGAARFVWLLDGEHITGHVRFNDSTVTISDPVIGYTYSMPTTLPLAVHTRGIGRLMSVDSDALPKMPNRFKLRNGEFAASMAVPISLPRVAWREVNKKIVWSIIQYQPLKGEWRVSRLKSTPTQTVYESQEILRALLGDVVYSKLREAVGLLSTPL